MKMNKKKSLYAKGKGKAVVNGQVSGFKNIFKRNNYVSDGLQSGSKGASKGDFSPDLKGAFKGSLVEEEMKIGEKHYKKSREAYLRK